MNKFRLEGRKKTKQNHYGIIIWNDCPNSAVGARNLNYFKVKKNLGKLIKQNMGQPRVINEMGNMSSYVTHLVTVLEGSGGWKESWLYYSIIIFICFVFILYCIHSKLSCPDRYFCNPVYSFHNSKACVMEKGFISKEFYVKNGIRQVLVDLYLPCSAFHAQDCWP